MRPLSNLIVLGSLILGVSPLEEPALAAGLALTEEGIVFPDGTEQTTAAISEVENYFHDSAGIQLTGIEGGKIVDFSTAVPEGYRALIEYVSVHCETPLANPMLAANLRLTRIVADTPTTRPFYIPLLF